jgi:hypothetical protein
MIITKIKNIKLIKVKINKKYQLINLIIILKLIHLIISQSNKFIEEISQLWLKIKNNRPKFNMI